MHIEHANYAVSMAPHTLPTPLMPTFLVWLRMGGNASTALGPSAFVAYLGLLCVVMLQQCELFGLEVVTPQLGLSGFLPGCFSG